MTAELHVAPPWREHRFPHKRIGRKVATARMHYRCDKHPPRPPGHVDVIEPGELYLRVSLRPDRHGSRGWTNVRLCGACALHYGLAVPERPERFA